MPRPQLRKKVISIRLSDEEFEQLQDLCTVRGIENISDLARTALKHLLTHERTNGKAAMEYRVNEMHYRVSVLDREVARISTMMGLARIEEAQ
jgi:hypothetical protein